MPEEVSPTHTEAVSFSAAVMLILGVLPLLCWCIVSFAVPRWALMRMVPSVLEKAGVKHALCYSVSISSRIHLEIQAKLAVTSLQPLDLKSLSKIGRNASFVSEVNNIMTEVVL